MRFLDLRRKILLFLAVMGPGIITASVDQDAGGISTYSLAGARYGYSMLWALFLIAFCLAIVQEMGARMGVVTGKGLADLIRGRYGLRVTLLVMAFLVFTNLANTVAEFAGVAASLEIFGVSRYISVPLVATMVGWLVVKGTYRMVERVFLGASLVYLVYIISSILARPEWSSVLNQTLIPTFKFDTGYIVMLITLVGTTIAPWMQFYLQSSIVDKGIHIRLYRYSRIDVFFGAIVAALVAYFIIVACGATLYINRINVETAAEAALALEPFAGRYASILFAFGLFNASTFAAAIVPLATAYAVCEGLGWETGIDRTFSQAPEFFTIYLAMVGIGAGVILLPKAPLLLIMFFSQTLNGILLPFILIIMLLLINDRDLMGDYVNSGIQNIIGVATAAIMIALTIILLAATLLLPS